MEQIIKTIKTEIKKKKLTYYHFSILCGITSGTLRNILNGTNPNPGIKTINAMLTALELNPYEKTPQGTYLTEKERVLLDMIISCDDHQQDMILAYIAGMKDNRNPGNVIIKHISENKTNGT